MANTYSQIHIQIVFAVKYRQSLIADDWKSRLYNYIAAIIQNQGHKLLAINGVDDHIHIFFGYRTHQLIPHLVQEIKRDSSEWINKNGFCNKKFAWQSGYGVFSYRKKDIPQVIEYIACQEIHHQKRNFLNEYERLLIEFEIEYNPLYLFKFPE